MKKILSFVLVVSIFWLPTFVYLQEAPRLPDFKIRRSPKPRTGFVIHGGAGVMRRGSLSPRQEKFYREKLKEALMEGYKSLLNGKTSIDAVEVAIKIMEDSPLFNAGKGSVFAANGKNELDASIMDGRTQNAGAVAGLHKVKNPITLARAVMEKSPHVMMIGDGAEKYAEELGITLVPEKYFWTQQRWDSLQKIIKREKAKKSRKGSIESDLQGEFNNKFGTVGAVALDKYGNLAAGTSTGGMTYKKYGRVGDVPVIGAGTYANNTTCAVSATGWGEFFIRLSVARDIASLMEYKNMDVQKAADTVIHKKLQDLGGNGGVIAIDKQGNIGISFNSEGMYRAYIDKNGKPVIKIYKMIR